MNFAARWGVVCVFWAAACGGGATTGDAGTDGSAGDGSTDGSAHDLGTDGGGADLGTDAGPDLGTDAGTCDADHDGHAAVSCGGDDCDDTNIAIHPGAPEVCDGVDDNCDGMIDEGVALVTYRDIDGDGFGDSTMSMRGCTVPSGYVLMGGDCDDTNSSVHPGTFDACDGIDNDCDGTVDPGCACMNGAMQACGTPDGSGGFLMLGACHPVVQTCVSGAWGICAGAVMPQPETCNGIDDNCDGTIDEGVAATVYRDVDGDGYGDPAMTMLACVVPAGYVFIGGDCNDLSAMVHPGAAEVCDGLDNNCNGVVDEGVTTRFYRDADGDTYGNPFATVQACAAPTGYVPMAADCNDTSAAIHPGAPEVCDGIDNNCDGAIDPGCSCTSGAVRACGASDGMGGFLMAGPCHVGSQSCVSGMWGTCTGSVGPTPETCNGADDDCNGLVDDGIVCP